MSILVIGGMGSIGSFVTRRLVEMEIEPVVYARHRNLLFFSDVEKNFIWVKGDILGPDTLLKAIRNYRVEKLSTWLHCCLRKVRRILQWRSGLMWRA